MKKLNVQSMANIFWSLSVLNYRKNEELITKLEDLIIKNAREFDSTVKIYFFQFSRIINKKIVCKSYFWSLL